jgi:hypothetical protein
MAIATNTFPLFLHRVRGDLKDFIENIHPRTPAPT